MIFEVIRGAGGGLGSLRVRCETCRASRTLDGIAGPRSLAEIGVSCRGSQPWEQTVRDRRCAERPQVLQRGASNLYFARVTSALDIPRADATALTTALHESIRTDGAFESLKTVASASSDGLGSAGARALIRVIAARYQCSEETVIELLRREVVDGRTESETPSEESLLSEEWATLTGPGVPETSPSQPFISESRVWHEWIRRVGGNNPFAKRLEPFIHAPVLVHRLREVRALAGFERLDPGTETVRPGLGTQPGWLPALEVFGEGVFLQLKETAVQEWLLDNRAWLESRVSKVRTQQKKAKLSFIPEVSARLLMVHTLAHLLVRQLAFESGYSASSLRERIFARESSQGAEATAGLLIYTADADSEGSMGGLAREGRSDRFLKTLTTALSKAAWCSADPICAELPSQGLAGLNHAACHACALVSETSCQWGNVLLDRTLVVGEHSYFGEWMTDDVQAPEVSAE